MTIRDNMASTYNASIATGNTISSTWGDDVNDTLDDKASKASGTTQTITSLWNFSTKTPQVNAQDYGGTLHLRLSSFDLTVGGSNTDLTAASATVPAILNIRSLSSSGTWYSDDWFHFLTPDWANRMKIIFFSAGTNDGANWMTTKCGYRQNGGARTESYSVDESSTSYSKKTTSDITITGGTWYSVYFAGNIASGGLAVVSHIYDGIIVVFWRE